MVFCDTQPARFALANFGHCFCSCPNARFSSRTQFFIDSLTARPNAAAWSSRQVRAMSYFGTLSAIATVVASSDPRTMAGNGIRIFALPAPTALAARSNDHIDPAVAESIDAADNLQLFLLDRGAEDRRCGFEFCDIVDHVL